MGAICCRGTEMDERPPRRRMPDPRAWVRKYLVDASVSWNMCLCSIRGMKERRLISSPAQTSSH